MAKGGKLSKTKKGTGSTGVSMLDEPVALKKYLAVETTGNRKLASVLQKINEAKLSKKQRRKLEAVRRKEQHLARIAAEEAGLTPEERTAREKRRFHMDQVRETKVEIAQLKKRINKLGKKSMSERDQRKALSKQIKALQLKLKKSVSSSNSETPATATGTTVVTSQRWSDNNQTMED